MGSTDQPDQKPALIENMVKSLIKVAGLKTTPQQVDDMKAYLAGCVAQVEEQARKDNQRMLQMIAGFGSIIGYVEGKLLLRGDTELAEDIDKQVKEVIEKVESL
jgi:hypothetical protein